MRNEPLDDKDGLASQCLNGHLEKLTVDGLRLYDPVLMRFSNGRDTPPWDHISTVAIVILAIIEWANEHINESVRADDWSLSIREGRPPFRNRYISYPFPEPASMPAVIERPESPGESISWQIVTIVLESKSTRTHIRDPATLRAQEWKRKNQLIDEDLDQGPARLGLLFQEDKAQLWFREPDENIISSDWHDWHDEPLWFVDAVLALIRLSNADLANDYGCRAQDADKRTLVIRTLRNGSIEFGIVLSFTPPPITDRLVDRGPFTWTTRKLGEGIQFVRERRLTLRGGRGTISVPYNSRGRRSSDIQRLMGELGLALAQSSAQIRLAATQDSAPNLDE